MVYYQCVRYCVCVDIGVNAHTSIDNSLFVELFVIVYMSRMFNKHRIF